MESKDRVIVIDLVGESEDTVVKAGRTLGHECRCGVCNCSGKDKAVGLALQLQSYEPFVPSGAAPKLRQSARKHLCH